jgi:glycosyltransferase 2 family protein
VHVFLHDAGVFFRHLAAVDFAALGIALAFQTLRLVVRTRAWRNIIAAAYPNTRVRWRSVLGAYLGGVGLNAITPARSGDVLKLFLVHRRVEGSTYPTLAATLVVETLFDFVVAGLLLLWAVQQGVLPGFSVLERLPSFDWAWFVRHPRFSLGLGLVAVVVAVVLVSRATKAFRHRFAEGFAILRSPKRYVATVVSWQAASWVCRIASTYFFLRAFGLAPDLRDAFVVQVVQSLATLLPFTPGGIGTEQGLLVYAFRGEAPATAVVSFSVGMHLAIVAANVALGFAALALMLRTVRWRRVVATGEEPA